MSKGAVLDAGLIEAVGLSDQLMTLTGPIRNERHPVLDEPMFVLQLEDLEEAAYLERSYVFEHQVSIKSTYGRGEQILVWLTRSLRPDPRRPGGPPVAVLLARDLFLLGDWREFQRFKQFIKSMRILDAQARQWLTDHHAEFPELARSDDGLERILDCLGRVAEWPELEGNGPPSRVHTLDGLAKTYSPSLVAVRRAPGLAALLLRRPPDERFAVFRLLGFVEDRERGTAGLTAFLAALAEASGNPQAIEATRKVSSGRALSHALATLRITLLSSR